MIMYCATFLVLLAMPTFVLAQAYPSKPVRLVVPYPPGASTDSLGRSVAQKMSESMGVSIIVENRGGASGNIGSDHVAKSAPDGYTFLLGTDATHTTNLYLSKNFPYDPIRDFTPVTAAAANIIALVIHPSVPAANMKELIEYGKRNPGKLAYGTSGTGSPHHLSGELLRQLAGLELVHVPYKGGGPAITDLLGGQIPMVFASMVTVTQLIKAGKVRVLGIGEVSRYQGMPDVPAIGETIPGFEMSSWLGFFGPAGLPQGILIRLHAEIIKALNTAEVRGKMDPAGLAVIGNTPQQFAAMIRSDLDKRGRLIRSAGIQPE